MATLTLEGKTLTITPMPREEANAIRQRRDVIVKQNRDVYEWDCGIQQGTYLGETEDSAEVPGGKTVAQPNLVLHHETWSNDQGTFMDKGKTDRAARRSLSKLGIPTLARLKGMLSAQMKEPRKRVPIEAFEKFNRYVSYTLQMEIEYLFVRLINSDLGVSIVLAVPNRVDFTANITAYCRLADWEAKIAADDRWIYAYAQAFVPTKSPENKTLRKEAAKAQEQEAQREIDEHGDKGLKDRLTGSDSVDRWKRALDTLGNLGD